MLCQLGHLFLMVCLHEGGQVYIQEAGCNGWIIRLGKHVTPWSIVCGLLGAQAYHTVKGRSTQHHFPNGEDVSNAAGDDANAAGQFCKRLPSAAWHKTGAETEPCSNAGQGCLSKVNR